VWSDSPLLRGRSDPDPFNVFGANGIVVLRGKVYVAITDAGVLVEIPIKPDGSAGEAQDWVQDDSLAGADGLAADVFGNIYVACNFLNTVVRVSPDKRLRTVVAGGLDAPASLAFGRGQDWRYLYITNFSWETGINHIARAKLSAFGLP
jgi:sugar lactone lactonase YvrE